MRLHEELEGLETPLRYEDVPVASWKGRVVRVVELDAIQRVEWADAVAAAKEANGGKDPADLLILARYIVFVSREPGTNEPCFEAADAERLARRHEKAVRELFTVASRLNLEGEKEVAAAAGKSDGTPADALPSASASP